MVEPRLTPKYAQHPDGSSPQAWFKPRLPYSACQCGGDDAAQLAARSHDSPARGNNHPVIWGTPHSTSSSSNALACLKSSVSKPSVNQP